MRVLTDCKHCKYLRVFNSVNKYFTITAESPENAHVSKATRTEKVYTGESSKTLSKSIPLSARNLSPIDLLLSAVDASYNNLSRREGSEISAGR